MRRLVSVPDGSVIRFPNSARYYMKVCDKNGVGGIVTLDTGMYVKTSDLSYLGLSADSVEIVAERGDWGVYCDVEG
jgi:hypothetical protein